MGSGESNGDEFVAIYFFFFFFSAALAKEAPRAHEKTPVLVKGEPPVTSTQASLQWSQLNRKMVKKNTDQYPYYEDVAIEEPLNLSNACHMRKLLTININNPTINNLTFALFSLNFIVNLPCYFINHKFLLVVTIHLTHHAFFFLFIKSSINKHEFYQKNMPKRKNY